MIERLRGSRWWGHPHVGACCLFLLVIGGCYWPVVDGSRSLVTNGPWSQPTFVIDALAGGPITAPLTRISAASWRHLQLPVVDPFQAFGVPLLPNQGVPVYPPQLIAHLLFPGNFSVWLVIDLVALAFGVYLLARAFGQGFSGAMAAGFLAALAGAAPPNVNMTMLNPLAVLPFVLLAVRYTADPGTTHRRAALLGIATSVALLCLSGFQEVLPLMGVVIGVYTVGLFVHHKTWRLRPRSILETAGSAAAGAIAGSIGFLPALAAVHGGSALNGPTSYLTHMPTYWLSTLVFPTVTGRSLNLAPTDLGNTVSTLGTPLLVLVVVLALALALRRDGAHTRWYVLPSVALVVFGVLAYADLGHVLGVMGIPLFDRIRSDRFVQFAWWIPLCLLLGAVITNARVLGFQDVLVGLVAAGAFGAYFYWRFVQALAASNVARDLAVVHAPIEAAVVVLAFVALIVVARGTGATVAGPLMAAVVLASCIYALPTNFAPAAYDGAVARVAFPGRTRAAGDQLAYFGPGTRQLPSMQYSVQLYGPIIPPAYADTLSGLFSATQSNGFGPLFSAQPTLAEVTLTPRAVSVLGSLGVDVLALSSPLGGTGFTDIPRCATGAAPAHALVCALGPVASPAPTVGFSPALVYVYRIVGAHPLVQPTTGLVPVGSTAVARRDLAAELSTSRASMPSRAFVTTRAAHLRAAHGVEGVSRHATAERVSITVRSTGAGLAVVRARYEAGMHAAVGGHAVRALPVDGGLWTAVPIGAGRARIVLDYVTTADLVELALGAAGLATLALLWIALGLCAARRAAQARASR